MKSGIRFTVKHEIRGRIRIHLTRGRLSIRQADLFSFYLASLPQVTAAKMNNDQVRVAFSFEDEWKKVKGEDSIVPNAGLGTTETFISEKPELVTEFEAAYEESLNWVLEHPADAAALAEEKLGLKAALVEKAIPNMGLIYKNAADAKTDLDGFYQLLNDFDPSMIGGKVPDEGMYYSK